MLSEISVISSLMTPLDGVMGAAENSAPADC
jgi:hypothetical protein